MVLRGSTVVDLLGVTVVVLFGSAVVVTVIVVGFTVVEGLRGLIVSGAVLAFSHFISVLNKEDRDSHFPQKDCLFRE